MLLRSNENCNVYAAASSPFPSPKLDNNPINAELSSSVNFTTIPASTNVIRTSSIAVSSIAFFISSAGISFCSSNATSGNAVNRLSSFDRLKYLFRYLVSTIILPGCKSACICKWRNDSAVVSRIVSNSQKLSRAITIVPNYQ